jgi:hypothetical protein
MILAGMYTKNLSNILFEDISHNRIVIDLADICIVGKYDPQQGM